jgi:hypothetical protein
VTAVIDDDIASARTLPASFYRDPAIFERVFARSWQFVDGAERAARPCSRSRFSTPRGGTCLGVCAR